MKKSGVNSFEELNKRGAFKEQGHHRFNIDQRQEKRNLTIVAHQRLQSSTKNLLSGKNFLLYFYEQSGKPNGKERFVKAREAIDNELDRLYALADDNEYFRIDIKVNKSLDRYFQSELKGGGYERLPEYLKNDGTEKKK